MDVWHWKRIEKNHKESENWYLQAAEQGHARAQSNLGVKYENGDGVKQSYKKAVFWYLKAAEQGYAEAQCNLGWMYQNGLGVDQDNNKAVFCYRKSSDQGHFRAKSKLGWMYEHGRSDKNVKQTLYDLGQTLPDGSIVFYVDTTGFHGWAVKQTDETDDYEWKTAIEIASSYGGGWHLPTKVELNLLYKSKNIVGSFADDVY